MREPGGPGGCDVAVDFTRPDAVLENAAQCLDAGVPFVVGTSGFDAEALDRMARDAGVPCFYAPNFALGAVLMMRFAEEAGEGPAARRDRRAPRRHEGRRAVRDGQSDG